MKHKIAIEETLRRVVEVEAETPALAVCMAEDGYNWEEHVLTGNDFIGVNIILAPEDKKAQEYLSDSAFRSYVERRFNGSSAIYQLLRKFQTMVNFLRYKSMLRMKRLYQISELK